MPNTDQSIEDHGIPRIVMQLSPLNSIPTSVDATLSNEGQAADAAATGQAIAQVQESIDSKNAETLYMDDTTETPENTIAARIEELRTALQELTASDIAYGENSDVAEKLDALDQAVTDLEDALYATEIPLSSSDSETISEKLTELEEGLSGLQGQTASDITYDDTAATPESIKDTVDAIDGRVTSVEQLGSNLQHALKVITISNVAGLPYSYNDAGITADMVVVKSILSNPVAQLCDWIVTAANGSITIDKAGLKTGIGYNGTDITLYLERTWSETAQSSLLKQTFASPPAGNYYTRNFATSDEESIFSSIVSSGSIRVHRSGQNISVRLQDITCSTALTAWQTYTIATLPENCRVMLMQQGQFVCGDNLFGLISVAAGSGEVSISPRGSNIPANTNIGMYMPILNVARDHNDQDMTGYTLTTP